MLLTFNTRNFIEKTKKNYETILKPAIKSKSVMLKTMAKDTVEFAKKNPKTVGLYGGLIALTGLYTYLSTKLVKNITNLKKNFLVQKEIINIQQERIQQQDETIQALKEEVSNRQEIIDTQKDIIDTVTEKKD